MQLLPSRKPSGLPLRPKTGFHALSVLYTRRSMAIPYLPPPQVCALSLIQSGVSRRVAFMPRHRASVSPTFHRPGGTVFVVECQLEASFAAEALHCLEPQSTGRTLWTEREATPGRCGGFNVKDTTRPLAGDRCTAGFRSSLCPSWVRSGHRPSPSQCPL